MQKFNHFVECIMFPHMIRVSLLTIVYFLCCISSCRSPSSILLFCSVSQAYLDHLCAVRFLLRAKAKRRLREEIRLERQRAVELRTATKFAEKINQQSARQRTLKPRWERYGSTADGIVRHSAGRFKPPAIHSLDRCQ